MSAVCPEVLEVALTDQHKLENGVSLTARGAFEPLLPYIAVLVREPGEVRLDTTLAQAAGDPEAGSHVQQGSSSVPLDGDSHPGSLVLWLLLVLDGT